MVASAKATFARDFIARVKSAREVEYSRSEMEALLKLPKGAYKKYETRALLQEVPVAYRTQINEVLLTALVVAVAGWRRGHDPASASSRRAGAS